MAYRIAGEIPSDWYVVSTKPRREEFAQNQLSRRGVASFLPRLHEPGADSEGTPAPLFPGYLFLNISLEQQYFDVVWTPGVKRFVGFGGLPAAVEPGVVDFLLARGDAGGVIRVARSFLAGDRVRVRRGPFEGLLGIVEGSVPARGRVRVLMELLRRQTRVELSEFAIERVNA